MKCIVCSNDSTLVGEGKYRGYCPVCEYWTMTKQQMDKRDYVFAIYKGKVYTLQPVWGGDEVEDPSGITVKITFSNGQAIRTSKLFGKGKPPEHMKELFPDNCKMEIE